MSFKRTELPLQRLKKKKEKEKEAIIEKSAMVP